MPVSRSAFDLTGRPVEGPATSPLTRLGLVHDQAAGVLDIARLTGERGPSNRMRTSLAPQHATLRQTQIWRALSLVDAFAAKSP